MRVGELSVGMVLRVREGNSAAWLTNSLATNHPTGDRELRFIMSQLAYLAPGILLRPGELIVYLGSETAIVNDSYTQLIRRVYVDGYACVITGRNFKYLEPHPSFTDV